MYYITVNDIPSGIYQSQVIDVVKYLSELGNEQVKLIAFLPISGFNENKKKIKSQLPKAAVLPIWAGITRWRMLKPLLKLMTKRNEVAICRGPIATELSLGCFPKVVYDGRAAVKAEVEEFNVTGNIQLGEDIINAEKNAVLKADFRIAVSTKLVKYWEAEFGYNSTNHVVIPCTLSSKADSQPKRKESCNLIKMVYSGGIGPWQSFDLIVTLVRDAMKGNENVSTLFLTNENESINQLIAEFPNRCERKWLNHDEVFSALSECDYGILIRSQNTTNQVASPVKFAEYLSAGLKVLISDNLGDFTDFVKENDCGEIVSDEIQDLKLVSNIEKQKIMQLANSHFTKESREIKQMYISLLTSIE